MLCIPTQCNSSNIYIFLANVCVLYLFVHLIRHELTGHIFTAYPDTYKSNVNTTAPCANTPSSLIFPEIFSMLLSFNNETD